jgi:hypothetical protein
MHLASRHAFLHALLIGVLLARAMVAPGFMPGSLSGGPLQLCPNGLPSRAVALLFGADPAHAGHAQHAAQQGDQHAHHGHAQDSQEPAAPAPPDSGRYEHCSIGEALSQVALTAAPAIPVALLRPLPPPSAEDRKAASATPILPRARGPPHSSPVS